MKIEARKKALYLMNKFRDENDSLETDCRKNSKHYAMIAIKEMLDEHSCITLDDGRWAFWAQVEIELNAISLFD